MQKALAEFSHFYNQIRPHQSLGGLTPDEAWQGKSFADVQQTHSHAEGAMGLWTGWPDGGVWLAMLTQGSAGLRKSRFQRCLHAHGASSAWKDKLQKK